MNQSGLLQGTRTTTWSPWGDRLLAALSILLAISAGLAWVQVFYLQQPLNEILAFDAVDLGLLGSQAPERTILGQHAFGDFQAWPIWSEQVLNGTYPSPPPPYLPMSYAYGALYMGLAPWPAVAIHQALTLGLTCFAAMLLLRGLAFSRRIIIVILTTVLTLPMIAVLDTGNKQGLTIALILLSVACLQRGWLRWSVVLLGIAISFKGYPAVVLIWPLALGMWRFVLQSLAVAVASNLVLFILLPGGFARNVSTYWEGLTLRPGQGMIDAESSLRALTSKLGGMLLGLDGASLASNVSLMALVAGVWLAVTFWVLRSHLLPEWASALLTLSLLQMVVPTTYNYALGWASIAALWFGLGTLVLPQSVRAVSGLVTRRQLLALRWLGLAALVMTLAPLGFRTVINGVVVNVSTIASPLLVTVFFGACLYAVLRARAFPN